MRGGGWETLGQPLPEGPAAGGSVGDLARCGAPPTAGVRPSIVARPQAAVRRIGPRYRRQVPMLIVPRRVPRLVSEDRSAHAPDLRPARITFASRAAIAVEVTRPGVRFRETGIGEVSGRLCIFHQSTASSGGAGSGGGTSRIENLAPQASHRAEPIAFIQLPARG